MTENGLQISDEGYAEEQVSITKRFLSKHRERECEVPQKEVSLQSDTWADGELTAYQNYQNKWARLTARGLRDKWLSEDEEGRVKESHLNERFGHPTRMVEVVETENKFAKRLREETKNHYRSEARKAKEMVAYLIRSKRLGYNVEIVRSHGRDYILLVPHTRYVDVNLIANLLAEELAASRETESTGETVNRLFGQYVISVPERNFNAIVEGIDAILLTDPFEDSEFEQALRACQTTLPRLLCTTKEKTVRVTGWVKGERLVTPPRLTLEGTTCPRCEVNPLVVQDGQNQIECADEQLCRYEEPGF